MLLFDLFNAVAVWGWVRGGGGWGVGVRETGAFMREFGEGWGWGAV